MEKMVKIPESKLIKLMDLGKKCAKDTDKVIRVMQSAKLQIIHLEAENKELRDILGDSFKLIKTIKGVVDEIDNHKKKGDK